LPPSKVFNIACPWLPTGWHDNTLHGDDPSACSSGRGS
jgi:hypothetical protein